VPRRAQALMGLKVLSALVALVALWGALALWYQPSPTRAGRLLALLGWSTLSLLCLWLLGRREFAWGLGGFAVAFAALLWWWRRIPASNARLWADDVAEMTSGSVADDRVTLYHVRNFDWRGRNDYTPRWETREFDLRQLRSVDLILSYWTIGAIAHVLISFGFSDGRQLVFSVEVRRQKSQAFSEVGGFFKYFELSVIAADERDVVRVRTNVRHERVYLYRLRLQRPVMRSLFLAYVQQANALIEAPRFYNTVTVNCTMLIYHMMTHIVGRLPLDYRVLLSGYLPGYVYKVGGLDKRYTLAELKAMGAISSRALAAGRDEFSADIRRGIPPLPAESEP
jgi:hypothetical protein